MVKTDTKKTGKDSTQKEESKESATYHSFSIPLKTEPGTLEPIIGVDGLMTLGKTVRHLLYVSNTMCILTIEGKPHKLLLETPGVVEIQMPEATKEVLGLIKKESP